ncbi:MAG: hypothetical protein ACRCUX_14730 [Beijerinckiaceae bacterium]
MIAAVSERGDLQLGDGRLARLPGLDLAASVMPAPQWERQRAALQMRLAGQLIIIDTGQGFTDRWDRVAIHARFADAGDTLHHSLIMAGLARVLPLDGNDACQRHLLPLEAEARRLKKGLWIEPALRVLAAREAEAIRAQNGRYALVEGRVVSVNARAQRTYINFGRIFTRDFSVTVSRRNRALLEKAGISLSSLTNRTVRVRGIVGGRTGPQMDIAQAAQIEIVE